MAPENQMCDTEYPQQHILYIQGASHRLPRSRVLVYTWLQASGLWTNMEGLGLSEVVSAAVERNELERIKRVIEAKVEHDLPKRRRLDNKTAALPTN